MAMGMRNPFTLPATKEDALRVWETANADDLWQWQYAGTDEFGNGYQRNIRTGKVVKIPKGVPKSPATDITSDDAEMERELRKYLIRRAVI